MKKIQASLISLLAAACLTGRAFADAIVPEFDDLTKPVIDRLAIVIIVVVIVIAALIIFRTTRRAKHKKDNNEESEKQGKGDVS